MSSDAEHVHEIPGELEGTRRERVRVGAAVGQEGRVVVTDHGGARSRRGDDGVDLTRVEGAEDVDVMLREPARGVGLARGDRGLPAARLQRWEHDLDPGSLQTRVPSPPRCRGTPGRRRT